MQACLYLRVSKKDQRPENQMPDLTRIALARGITVVDTIIEKKSGAKRERAGLKQLLKGAHEGRYSHVIVWSLDRLGRTMRGVVETVQALDAINVQVISHQEPWLSLDGPVRPLLLAIFAWVAEQERQRIIERTEAGIETAKANGKIIGRPKVSIDLDEAFKLRKQGLSIEATAKRLGCGVGTLHRALAKAAA